MYDNVMLNFVMYMCMTLLSLMCSWKYLVVRYFGIIYAGELNTIRTLRTPHLILWPNILTLQPPLMVYKQQLLPRIYQQVQVSTSISSVDGWNQKSHKLVLKTLIRFLLTMTWLIQQLTLFFHGILLLLQVRLWIHTAWKKSGKGIRPRQLIPRQGECQ